MPPLESGLATAAGRRRWLSPAIALGLCAVAAARLLTLPQGPWEQDEVLFIRGVERFAPAEHRPHPPGYPLTIGLGKLAAAAIGDPFRGLVALGVASSLAGFLALAWAYRGHAQALGMGADAERVAVAGALLFHFSPAMLIYGPLALSDPPALAFLSLWLAAWARVATLPAGHGAAAALPSLAVGMAAAAAIGCRPQLLPAVGLALAVALALMPRWRQRGWALAGFAGVALAWGLPLLAATGGPFGLIDAFAKQAGTVAEFDAGGVRAGRSAGWVATRFLAHPWGTRLTALPMLALAALGAYRCWRGQARRILLPLLVLAGADLVVGLLALHPDDAVRYALPSLLAIAFLAAVGIAVIANRLGRLGVGGWWAYAAAAALIAGMVGYAAPLLRARAREQSPAMQAVAWAAHNLPASSAVLVEPVLAPFASQYLERFRLAPVTGGPAGLAGLERFALRGDVPLWLLGDGASTWPDAVAFSWPPSDAYGKLTRGVLRVVSWSPIPAAVRYRPMRGVHEFEPSLRERRYRWLAGDAAVELEPRGGAALVLTLALPSSAPWPENRVAASVGGAAPEVIEVPRGGARTVALALPAGDRVELELRSERTFVAAEAGLGSDRRPLAVQLVELRVAAASESAPTAPAEGVNR